LTKSGGCIGEVEIGEFTTGRSDFTAIGGVVNLAARLEAQAAACEILVSEETVAQAQALAARAPTRKLTLKGIAYPVQAHVLIAGDCPLYRPATRQGCRSKLMISPFVGLLALSRELESHY